MLHRDLRARSLAERQRAGAPDAPLVASAVAATFAGVLADWLHGLLRATSEEVAHQVWQLLVALHRSADGRRARPHSPHLQASPGLTSGQASTPWEVRTYAVFRSSVSHSAQSW